MEFFGGVHFAIQSNFFGHLSRTLTKLRKEGLIDIPGAAEIMIRNRPALHNLAEGMT